MITVNENYLKLKSSYLFSDVARRVDAYGKSHPDREVIRLGIGDATRALPRVCIDAFHKATNEMANDATFHGYGDEQGYGFLKEKVAEFDYRARGADISPDEVFISDGAKCDTGNFQELFSTGIRIAIPDPVYPVYVDSNVMAGRTGAFENGRYAGMYYLESTPRNSFVPDLPSEHIDLVYLCFPNNPTGAAITRQQLVQWVEWARANKALISTMPPMWPSSGTVRFRKASSKYRARGMWLWSFAAIPRRPGSPGRAAPTPSSRNRASPLTLRAGRSRCMHYGTGATPPSSTAYVIWCSARRKPFTPRKAKIRSGRSTIIIWAMPRLL